MTPDISEAQQQRNDRIIVLALTCLTLLGLAFRLYWAWGTNQTLPDTPARLTGDEPGYEGFGYDVLKGHFFDWPGPTPIYPFFVAGCYTIFGRSPASVAYVQAFLGATIIPLNFILARRFTGAQISLVFATVASLWLFYFDSIAHLCRSSLQRAAAPDFGGRNCYGCGETSASVEVN
ncbi:hypothetical protein [Microcoleus sp. herbarium2]|uniref:hypothetical protein n=1 Tax=Microcoleus sp. herbarium2 TaxID=3055433 RepID=UPI002FD1514E